MTPTPQGKGHENPRKRSQPISIYNTQNSDSSTPNNSRTMRHPRGPKQRNGAYTSSQPSRRTNPRPATTGSPMPAPHSSNRQRTSPEELESPRPPPTLIIDSHIFGNDSPGKMALGSLENGENTTGLDGSRYAPKSVLTSPREVSDNPGSGLRKAKGMSKSRFWSPEDDLTFVRESGHDAVSDSRTQGTENALSPRRSSDHVPDPHAFPQLHTGPIKTDLVNYPHQGNVDGSPTNASLAVVFALTSDAATSLPSALAQKDSEEAVQHQAENITSTPGPQMEVSDGISHVVCTDHSLVQSPVSAGNQNLQGDVEHRKSTPSNALDDAPATPLPSKELPTVDSVEKSPISATSEATIHDRKTSGVEFDATEASSSAAVVEHLTVNDAEDVLQVKLCGPDLEATANDIKDSPIGILQLSSTALDHETEASEADPRGTNLQLEPEKPTVLGSQDNPQDSPATQPQTAATPLDDACKGLADEQIRSAEDASSMVLKSTLYEVPEDPVGDSETGKLQLGLSNTTSHDAESSTRQEPSLAAPSDGLAELNQLTTSIEDAKQASFAERSEQGSQVSGIDRDVSDVGDSATSASHESVGNQGRIVVADSKQNDPTSNDLNNDQTASSLQSIEYFKERIRGLRYLNEELKTKNEELNLEVGRHVSVSGLFSKATDWDTFAKLKESYESENKHRKKEKDVQTVCEKIRALSLTEQQVMEILRGVIREAEESDEALTAAKMEDRDYREWRTMCLSKINPDSIAAARRVMCELPKSLKLLKAAYKVAFNNQVLMEEGELASKPSIPTNEEKRFNEKGLENAQAALSKAEEAFGAANQEVTLFKAELTASKKTLDEALETGRKFLENSEHEESLRLKEEEKSKGLKESLDVYHKQSIEWQRQMINANATLGAKTAELERLKLAQDNASRTEKILVDENLAIKAQLSFDQQDFISTWEALQQHISEIERTAARKQSEADSKLMLCRNELAAARSQNEQLGKELGEKISECETAQKQQAESQQHLQYELGVAKFDYDCLQQQFDEKNAELELLQKKSADNQTTMESELAASRSRVESLKQDLANTTSKFDVLNKQSDSRYAVLKAKYDHLLDQKGNIAADLEETKALLTEERNKFAAERVNAMSNEASLQRNLSEKQTELSASIFRVEALEIEGAEDALDILDFEEEAAHLKGQRNTLLSNLRDVRTEKHDLETRLDSSLEKLHAAEVELSMKDRETENLQAILSASQETVASIINDIHQESSDDEATEADLEDVPSESFSTIKNLLLKDDSDLLHSQVAVSDESPKSDATAEDLVSDVSDSPKEQTDVDQICSEPDSACISMNDHSVSQTITQTDVCSGVYWKTAPSSMLSGMLQLNSDIHTIKRRAKKSTIKIACTQRALKCATTKSSWLVALCKFLIFTLFLQSISGPCPLDESLIRRPPRPKNELLIVPDATNTPGQGGLRIIPTTSSLPGQGALTVVEDTCPNPFYRAHSRKRQVTSTPEATFIPHTWNSEDDASSEAKSMWRRIYRKAGHVVGNIKPTIKYYGCTAGMYIGLNAGPCSNQ